MDSTNPNICANGGKRHNINNGIPIAINNINNTYFFTIRISFLTK
ncbi:hypothetical protein BN1095_490016 [Clostridioides difficile]|uniref:Uncharacterized protein n=1 Tax=Clostridioides difficile TaxID=1496 RepID=A0A069A6Q3_CLODI|nr:hypothetical protein BN183_730006 [Clostridioides difficile E7]CCL71099.1 hypothetical protein BN184_660009 [Clostridioides difficile T3]CCL74691.1 hypothetical protein BN185_610010 [Clostridioides difficile E28]CCL82399.1 hypothetical protein BN187_730009 [Clostridioides difficile E12]CCL93624.1 hypothetical protein BN190_820008 [Clostridioides difficile T14]CDS83841.1 hypothetical protein BN1096_240026 [Clostridioides difficile]